MSSPADERMRQVAVRNVPVLCVDTCSVLDLIRDPMRSDVSARDVADTLGLIPLIQRGAVIGLMAGQVERELDERLEEVEDETRNSLRKYYAALQKVDCLAAHYDGLDGLDLSRLEGHVDRAKMAVSDLVRDLLVLDERNDVAVRAFARMREGVKPARRGNGDVKDCIVIESYFDAARDLRNLGFQGPIVFVTANKKDYCDGGRSLAPALRGEFDSVQMEFALGMMPAKRLLGF